MQQKCKKKYISDVWLQKSSVIYLFVLFFQKDWLFNVLGKLSGPNMDFLMKVETIYYANLERFFPCDAFLTAVLLFPECVRKKFDCYATVELGGRESRGRLCIGHQSKNPPNVTIIECLHKEPVKNAFIFAADHK